MLTHVVSQKCLVIQSCPFVLFLVQTWVEFSLKSLLLRETDKSKRIIRRYLGFDCMLLHCPPLWLIIVLPGHWGMDTEPDLQSLPISSRSKSKTPSPRTLYFHCCSPLCLSRILSSISKLNVTITKIVSFVTSSMPLET